MIKFICALKKSSASILLSDINQYYVKYHKKGLIKLHAVFDVE